MISQRGVFAIQAVAGTSAQSELPSDLDLELPNYEEHELHAKRCLLCMVISVSPKASSNVGDRHRIVSPSIRGKDVKEKFHVEICPRFSNAHSSVIEGGRKWSSRRAFSKSRNLCANNKSKIDEPSADVELLLLCHVGFPGCFTLHIRKNNCVSGRLPTRRSIRLPSS